MSGDMIIPISYHVNRFIVIEYIENEAVAKQNAAAPINVYTKQYLKTENRY